MPSDKVMYRPQLCWKCKKADGSGDCPWVNNFKPVEGWNARQVIRTKIEIVGSKNNRFKYRRKIKSYEIIECPLFKPDRKRKKKVDEK